MVLREETRNLTYQNKWIHLCDASLICEGVLDQYIVGYQFPNMNKF